MLIVLFFFFSLFTFLSSSSSFTRLFNVYFPFYIFFFYFSLFIFYCLFFVLLFISYFYFSSFIFHSTFFFIVRQPQLLVFSSLFFSAWRSHFLGLFHQYLFFSLFTASSFIPGSSLGVAFPPSISVHDIYNFLLHLSKNMITYLVQRASGSSSCFSFPRLLCSCSPSHDC